MHTPGVAFVVGMVIMDADGPNCMFAFPALKGTAAGGPWPGLGERTG